MADTQIKEGDQVSWQWSGSQPGGTVAQVATEGKVTMETKNGNEVSKNAEPNNPAVYVERSGHDVVKKASELNVEAAGDKHKEDKGEEKTVTESDKPKDDDKKDDDKKDDDKKDEEKKDDKPEANGEAKAGDKRKADEPADENKEDDDSKKQKTNGDDKEAKQNGQTAEPKKKGRPAKGDAAKKETKKREPKRAATESGEPRRSGRNASK